MTKKADIEVSQQLQGLAHGLEEVLTEMAGEKVLFCLTVFSNVENGGRHSYISNGLREDVAKELRRLLEHLESDEPQVPVHKFN